MAGKSTTPREQIVSSGIFVGCSPAMKAQLADLAKLEHRTLSGLIRLLIERRLARHDRTRRHP
jgi:hypothetical protein